MSISINVSIDPNIYPYMLFAMDKYASHWKYSSKSKGQDLWTEKATTKHTYFYSKDCLREQNMHFKLW